MDAHKRVVDILNEVLEELRIEYAGSNLEYGVLNVNKDGITEKQRKHLHSYRERLNQIHIQ